MTSPRIVGDADRIYAVFLNDSDELETPTALTVKIQSPADGVAEIELTEASPGVTLNKIPPKSIRERLAATRVLSAAGITADDLATAPNGCVEVINVVDAPDRWQYVINPTAPTTHVVKAATRVVAQFD